MNLVKRNSNLLPELPKFFDDFVSKDFFDWSNSNFSSNGLSVPAVNLMETNEAYEVEMAAPGLHKQDFNIELDNEVLSISCRSENQETSSDQRRSIRREFSYQSFQRTFYLPKKVVESEKIGASYIDGVLKVVIPKKEEAKALPPRTIKIK